MIRNRIVNGQKASDATYVAHANLVRGMGVVKSTGGKTAFATEETDKAIFLVDRDNLPSGIDCVYTDRPDVTFDNIAEGEKVILRPYVLGESFYTSVVDGNIADYAESDGQSLIVNENGRWLLGGGTLGKYVSRGVETVAGMAMLVVEVVA
jgi:hypothetical protein